MKKKLFKCVVAMLGIYGIACVGSLKGFAIETGENGTDIVTAVKEDIQEGISNDFNLDISLNQAQEKLLTAIQEKMGKSFETELEEDYLNILGAVESSDLILSDQEEENVMYSEFASIYLMRIASILPVEPTDEQFAAVLQEKDNLLIRTFNDIKVENMNLIFATEKVAPKARATRAGFNVSNASSYARTWWNRRNMLFPTYSSDCTNFASQIAYYGGKGLRNSPNASGMTWTHNGGVTASSPWKLAHNFIVFWTADGCSTRQFTSKADAQSYTREGDFIGYFKKNTYQITHVAYVSKKSGATAYITQHTTDRKDTSWNSINTNDYSSFIVLRF